MIERVILNILKENGFDGYEKVTNDYFKSVIFTYRKDNYKTEFYVVVSIDQKAFLDIDENKMFSDISKSLKGSSSYVAEVDKNTSLVICVAKDSKLKSDEILESKGLQTEENPYFFKKYVLSYDEKIAEEVFGEMLEDYNEFTNITKYIESVITNPEKFRNFKLNPVNNEDYMLLSKIIMKIPVIPVKVPDNKSIKPLSSMINESISSENLQKAQNIVTFLSEEKHKENDLNESITRIIDYWIKE